MLKHRVAVIAGTFLLPLSICAAAGTNVVRLAQLGPPPPGSAFGTESGTYGSSVGVDVRGSSAGDLMNPNDPIERTDPRKMKERDAQEKEAAREKERERLDPRSNPSYNTRATESARMPGSVTGEQTGVPGSRPVPGAPGGTPGPATPGSGPGAPAR